MRVPPSHTRTDHSEGIKGGGQCPLGGCPRPAVDRKAGAARHAGALTTAAGPPDTGQSRAGRHLLAQRPQDSQGLAAGSLGKRGDAGKATPPGPCLGAQRAVARDPCPSFTLDRCAGTAATMGQAKMSQGHPATGPLRQDGHSHRRDHGGLVGGGPGARIPGARPRKWEAQGIHAVSCGAARSPHAPAFDNLHLRRSGNRGPGSRHFGRPRRHGSSPQRMLSGSLSDQESPSSGSWKPALPVQGRLACASIRVCRRHPCPQRGPQPPAPVSAQQGL